MSARAARRLTEAALGAAVLVLLQVVSGPSAGFAVTAAAAPAPVGHPNRFQSGVTSGRPNHLPKPKAVSGPAPTYDPPRTPPPVPMQPGLVALDPVAGAHFLGSDGVLELTAPAGAVTAADVAAAGGGLSLLVRQVQPASGSNAGGSGRYTFGTWLVQVVDAAGGLTTQGLRQPLAVRLHPGGRVSALDLEHVQVLVNPGLPWWVNLDPASVTVPAPVTPASGARRLAPAKPATTPAPPTGARRSALSPVSRQAAALDVDTGTLSAALPASGPSTAMSFDTDAPVATFGRPDPFETDLAAGALSAGIKLDLPAGQGGLTPPLTLAYNSAAVSDQHNPQGAAPWVGEGWSLGLGAISWAEHDVNSTCSPTPCSSQWEDSWQLSDPYGTAAELVPPDINVKTYNDDTPNAFTASPITWHTAPESRAKVISYTTPAPPPGMSPQPPCFRAFLPTGIIEEFGCTPDSLQYYPQPSGANQGVNYIASWLLDLIIDAQGNQIHVSYQRDVATGAGGVSYPRDAVLGTVEWDSPGCVATQDACAGAGWAPLMRVNFVAGHAIAHVSGSSCAANGSLRCDDPVDLSGSGGLPAPTVQSTFVLNDAQVQVRSSATASWNTLRDYQFSYDQSAPWTTTDPVSGLQQSTAGKLLLTQLRVIGADGTSSLPPRTFGYTNVAQWYEDSIANPPLPSGNCGPSWNNGNTPNGHTGCVLWSQSFGGNNAYLSSVSNGLGLSETFTWQLARSNAHGVVSGSPADPYACNDSSLQATFPCNMPDDQGWSRVVLSARSDIVVRSSSGQGAQPVTSTWTYTYQVPYPLQAQLCPTCVASFYWGNQNDFDALDFYNNRFMGFAQTNAQLPDNSVEFHKFHSTEGFGLYDVSQHQLVCNAPNPCHNDPWSDLGNAAHGHEYELDRYATDGSTLLQQVKTRWGATCPPLGVTGTPFNSNYGNWDGNLVTELDHSNPVMVCEVQPLQVDRLTYDGTGGPPVHSATAYTYDSLGRVASQTQLANANAVDASGHGSHAALSGGVTQPVSGLVGGDTDTAMAFDGSTGTVPLNLAAVDTVAGHQVTVELWMKWSGSSAQAMPFGFNGYDLWLAPGTGFGFNTGNSDLYGVPMSAVPANTPLHVVAVFTNGGVGSNKLYLNGVQQTLSQLAGTPLAASATAAANVSGWSRDSRYGFGGTLDEVAVYNGALPAARVSAHFGAGAGYKAAVLADVPLAYYRLDDGVASGPNAIVSRPQYVWNDAVVAGQWSANGRYLLDFPAFSDLEDQAGSRNQCAYTGYDGQAFTAGASPALTAGKPTTQDRYTGCGTAPGFTPSGQIRTAQAYDPFGNPLASTDADANAGNSAHVGCTVGATSYSSCTTHDGTFEALPVATSNALGQRSLTGYQSPAAPSPALVDSSGHGNQATWNGSMASGQPGLVGGDADTAAGLDGMSSFVQLPAAPFGAYPTSGSTNSYAASFEAWFQTTAGGVILGQTSGQTWPATPSGWLPALYVDSSGGLSESLFWHGAVSAHNYAAGPYNDGRPHHVVATYAGGTDSLYVDGQLRQSIAQSEVGYSATYAYSLGTGYTQSWPGTNGTWWGFNGKLDEVAVYGAALPAGRVTAHFNAGAGYKASVLADSPAAYWRLDDSTGAAGPGGGFGLWPVTRTDANGQTTTLSYDALGRETGRTLPGESGSGLPAVVADAGGRGWQAAWSGGTGFGAPGLVSGDTDTAMTFDGASGYLAGPALGPLQGGSARSVELWFKTSSTGAQQLLDGSGVWATGQSFQLGLTGTGTVGGSPPVNTPGVYLSLFSDDVYLPGLNLGDGQAHHLVVTLSGSSVQIYVDGATPQGMLWNGSAWSGIVGQPFTLPSAPSTAASPLWIGQARSGIWGGGSRFFNGTLDEVAVYDHVLSGARVAAHRTAGSGYRATVLADAPSAYYRLDDTAPALTTLSTSYTVWCTGTAAQAPCVEVDKTQRLNASTTVTSRAFYDGLGHLVETRSPAPGGQDVIRYSFYDVSQRLAFQSVPYFGAAHTGGPGAAAFAVPDSGQAGTTYSYDGLGRTLTATDALSFQSRKSYAVACGAAGTGDPACYEQTQSVDGKGHQGGTLVDGLGRTAYVQRYTGSSSANYAVYATAKYAYDYAGNLVKIVQPDGITQTTFGYDMAGRKTSMSDPDLGAQTYSYDQDGSLVQSVDARGAAGTIFAGYDGLDRPVWRNTTNNPSGAYDTYTYDSTAGGNMGTGRLTGQTFSAGSLSGSYAYSYDGRGRQTASTLIVSGGSYPLASTYDDAGNVLTQGYPDGETITNSYSPQGWLSGVSTTKSGTTTNLASGLAYTGVGGAFGELTAMHLGGGYDFSATYDLLDRATDLKTKRTSDGAVLLEQARTFDGAGNVTTTQTTMPGGTDNQAFCYDEQDRLTWASSVGTPPCGTPLTAGTLTAAQYTQSFTYDAMGRLTTGGLGSYTYGNAAHVHAATAIGTAWTAAYDGAGNMTCRAPNQSSTCAGIQSGSQLAYNNEGELSSWQSAPTSPSTTAQFLYDGQGQRVAQVLTQSGTTTTTVYVGDVEEVTTSGGTTTTTAYYYAAGKRIGLSANGAVSYLASDGLGSADVTLSASGSATASVLYAPYGGTRYSSGTMAGTYGFTGQRADAASGLDYYGARYYDPLASQFTSGDTLIPGGGFDVWGLSRYAYVGGNPVVRVDPTGHSNQCPPGGCGGDDPPPPPIDPGGDGGGNGGCDVLPDCGLPPPAPPPAGSPPTPTPPAGSPSGTGPTACDILPACAAPPPPPAPSGSCQLDPGACQVQPTWDGLPDATAIAPLGQRPPISDQGGCFSMRVGDRGGSCSTPPPVSGEDPFVVEGDSVEGWRIIWVGEPDSGKKPGGRREKRLGPAFRCAQSTLCRLLFAAAATAIATIISQRPWQPLHENPETKPEIPNEEVPDGGLYQPSPAPKR